MEKPVAQQITLQGIGASRGLAVGKVMLLRDEKHTIELKKVGEEGVPGEIARLQDALLATRRQLMEIRKHVEVTIDEQAASIFDAHLAIIDDASFIEKIITALRKRKINLEHVLQDVMREYAKAFTDMEDVYIQERGADVKDLMNRILQNLAGSADRVGIELDENVVIVAKDLLPSITATLDKNRILGIATEMGGLTSHAAIIARALEIPAVVGLEGLCECVKSGDTLLIDGSQGRVLLNPSSHQQIQYGHLENMRSDLMEGLREHRREPAVTRDGRTIRVCANLELPDHLERVLDSGADGIGLYRTEFLFLSRPDLPTEDEQAAAYEAVAEAMHPSPVVIRTLDVGGDKLLSHLHMQEQSSSPLGCRGIRLSLARPDIFKVQLRALLRAARFGNVKVMYPMVSGVDEIRQANELLQAAAEELKSEGWQGDLTLQSGVMIETPSAALTVDNMSGHTQFFSLGTNDLIQYTIAVDRLERQVASLYDPLHLGVLKLIQHTVNAANTQKINVSVCGEMGGSPLMLPMLIGLGLPELSVAPGSVPLLKHLIRCLHYQDAVELVKWAFTEPETRNILKACRKMLERDAPKIKELFIS